MFYCCYRSGYHCVYNNKRQENKENIMIGYQKKQKKQNKNLRVFRIRSVVVSYRYQIIGCNMREAIGAMAPHKIIKYRIDRCVL